MTRDNPNKLSRARREFYQGIRRESSFFDEVSAKGKAAIVAAFLLIIAILLLKCFSG
jgi:hypothetical protein